MNKAVIITRQRGESTTGTEQQTLDAQVREIEDFARRMDLQIVDRVVCAGISARDLTRKTVAYLQEHLDVSAIITYSPDRLFRDYCSYEHLSTLLKSRDIKLFFAFRGGEHLYQRRPLEFLQEECSAAIDQQILGEYTKLHGHRIRRTLLAKAEQGIWPARPPIGYKAAVLQCGQRGILPDDHTADLICWLFNEYATGDYSLKQLVEVLRFRKYGLSISRSKIVHILRNPFYEGDFVWKGKLFRGSHEPIISHALWERVQSVLSRVLGNGSKQKRMAGSRSIERNRQSQVTAVAYTRVSAKNQRNFSIPAQLKLLREYANSMGIQIDEGLHFVEENVAGISGEPNRQENDDTTEE